MLNITIRVNSAQALAAVKSMQGAINSMGSTAGGAASGGVGNLNRAFGLSNLEKFGKNLQWTGRQLEYNFTLPLVLAGGAATKFALDNEAAFTQISKAYSAFEGQTANTGAELNELRKTFELLSDRFGIQQKEVLTIAADWAQAGASGVALAKATRLTMETMVLGQESAGQATESLLTIQGAYRLNTDQLRAALVSLNAIQVTTAIEFGGLVDAVARAGGAAITAGIDLNHLGAMAAALVPATGSAAAAGNALRTMISRLMAPTQQSAEEMAMFGINVADASWQAKDGVQRFETLAQAFHGLSDGQQNLVSSVIASRWQINRFDVLMKDIIDTSGVYNTALKNTNDSQKAAALYAQQLSTVLSSSPQAFKILTTTIQNGLAKAIVPLLPALTNLLSLVARGVDWFTRLSPDVQQLALSFLVLLAAVGPVTRYLGSFTLLGTTVGKAFFFATGHVFGFSEAQKKAAEKAGKTNLTMIQQHGILGLLKIGFMQIIGLPFRALGFMFETLWAGFIGGAGEAIKSTDSLWIALLKLPFAIVGATLSGMVDLVMQSMLLAGRGVIALATYLSGPLMTAIADVAVWVGATLPEVARVAASAAAGAFSAVLTTLSNFGSLFVAIVNKTESLTQAIWAVGSMGVRAIWVKLVSFAESVGAAIAEAWVATQRAVAIGWVLVTTAIQRAWFLLTNAAEVAGTYIALAWESAAEVAGAAWVAFTEFIAEIPAISAAVWAAAERVWTVGYGVLEALTSGFTAVLEAAAALWPIILANPWIALIAAVAAVAGVLVFIFRDQIVGGIVRAFNALPKGLQNILLNVVNMIKSFAMAVRDWLSYLNPFARHSPSLVDNVSRGMDTILSHYKRLKGVPEVIRQAAQAHQAFNKATDSASHTSELAKMQQQKSDIVAVSPDAGPAVDNLVNSIFQMRDAAKAVNEQLTDQQNLVDDMQRQVDQDIKPWTDAINANEMAQKQLRLEIARMDDDPSIQNVRNQMAGLKTQITDMQRAADAASHDIEVQMRPWNDAIYANEEAQKKLRLEILKMKEAGQSIDDIRDKMSKLQGAIESLSGQREDLRLAGAGSDVLGQYDDQIKALREQQRVFQEMGSPIDDLQKKLDDLQTEGEKLNLEKDLQFDPQLKAIDDQKNAISDLTDQYDGLQNVLDHLLAPVQALKDQLDQLQNQADIMNLQKDIQFAPQLAELDAEKQKLQDLQSAYSDINSAISDMEGSFNSMASAAKSALDAASSGGSLAADQFNAAAGANFPDVGGSTVPGLGNEGGLPDIQDFNKQLQDELDGALKNMGGFDMFAPLKDMWNSTWKWIKDNVGPVVAPVVDGIKQAFDVSSVGPNMGGLFDTITNSSAGAQATVRAIKDLFSDVLNIFIRVGDYIGQVFGPVWSWLGDQVQHVADVLGPELARWSPLFDKATEAIGHVATVIETVFKYTIVPIIVAALAVVLGIWKAVWPVLSGVLEPILNFIVEGIRTTMELVRSTISLFLDIINGDWGAAWQDILDFVTGIWDAIYNVLKLPIDLIVGLVSGLVDGIVGFFQWLYDELVGHSIIPDMINAIIWWFNFMTTPIQLVWAGLWAALSWAWENIGSPIVDAIKWVFTNVLVPAFQWVASIAGGIWDDFMTGLPIVWDAVGRPVFDAIKWVFDNVLVPAFQIGVGIAGDIWSGLGVIIGAIWDNGISPVFEAIKTGIGLVGQAMLWVKDNVIGPVWNSITSIVSGAWDVMKSVLEGGINFFVDIFNLLANGVNTITDALGLGSHVPTLGHVSLGGGAAGSGGGSGVYRFARGGIPVAEMGGPGFMTNVPTAIVGEGNNSYPEYVIPTDPAYRKRALDLFASLGTKILGWGDVLGGAGDVAGGIAGGVTSVFGDVKDTVVGAAQMAKAFWDFINEAIAEIGNVSVDVIRGAANFIKDDVIQWGKGKILSIPGAGTLFDIGGSVLGAGQDILSGAGDVLGNINPFARGGIPALAQGGIVPARPGGTVVRLAERGKAEAVVPLGDSNFGGETHLHFHGDLVFPNVRDGKDAEDLIGALEGLAG